MTSNYDAWNIDTNTLNVPADLLRLAVLAPSSHNSQPWRLTIEGDSIHVSLEPTRRLKDSDSNDRQAIISLGCAAEHIAIGAEYYGYEVHTEYYRADDQSARIHLSNKGERMNDPRHLVHWIPKRTTNRAPYEDRSPDEQALNDIRALAQPTLHIDIITSKGLVEQLGAMAVEAGIDAMRSGGFRKELSRYLKPNTTKDSLGMPGSGFGFPTPLSHIAPFLVRFANMAKISRKQDEALFAHTPALIIMSTTHDTPADWFLAGRSYARAALIAARDGMSTAPWGAPIQIGEHYRRIQRMLDLTSRPQLFCRMGYPTASTPHTPRLSAVDVQ